MPTSKLDKLKKELCPNGVKYMEIGDFCNLSSGKINSKKDMENHNGIYPVYSGSTTNNGIMTYIDTYDYDGEFITWTIAGSAAGTVFYRNEKFSGTQMCGVLKVKEDFVMTKYLYYVATTLFHLYVKEGMGLPTLTSGVIKKIEVPVPPLPIQEEIVRILDTFPSMTNELKEEIELQKTQINYYRNKLLSFN